MCFSAEADFAAAAAVGAIGISTLQRVKTRQELLIGALPAMFAAHQFLEGLVWLGARNQIPPPLADVARDAYVTFAYVALPIIVPTGLLLLEPDRRRRRWVAPFVALGTGVGAAFAKSLIQRPVDAIAHARGIEYDTHDPHAYGRAVLYAIATCVPALLSSRPYIRRFGAVNIAAAAITTTTRRAEFTSVWCLHAALASLLIREHFARQLATG